MTLISRGPNFEYHGALYRSATGRSPLEVVIPFSEIFEGSKNVEIVLDDVVKVDPLRKIVKGADGDSYAYDIVVFALGNTVNYFGIEGMEKNSHTMTTIPSTIALRQELVALFKTKSTKKARVVIVGAGPTGVELAGEAKNFASLVAKQYQVPGRSVEVSLIEGASRVLPSFSEKASKKAEIRLRSLGVHLLLNCKVNNCEKNKVCLDSADLEADIIVWTAGSKNVDFFSSQPKVFEIEKGKVVVDEHLHALGHEHIYVIGDNALTPYSGMAQTALHNAIYVARNIVRQQHGHDQYAYHPVARFTLFQSAQNGLLCSKANL